MTILEWRRRTRTWSHAHCHSYLTKMMWTIVISVCLSSKWQDTHLVFWSAVGPDSHQVEGSKNQHTLHRTTLLRIQRYSRAKILILFWVSRSYHPQEQKGDNHLSWGRAPVEQQVAEVDLHSNLHPSSKDEDDEDFQVMTQWWHQVMTIMFLQQWKWQLYVDSNSRWCWTHS